MRVYTPKLVWAPHPNRDTQRAVERVIDEWKGTPYQSGQRLKGLAADCVGSVCGILDELDGRDRAGYPELPHDAAFHNRREAMKGMAVIVRRYRPVESINPNRFEEPTLAYPGNIVVLGQGAGGPGHVAIVGARENELWHATQAPGFHQQG